MYLSPKCKTIVSNEKIQQIFQNFGSKALKTEEKMIIFKDWRQRNPNNYKGLGLFNGAVKSENEKVAGS